MGKKKQKVAKIAVLGVGMGQELKHSKTQKSMLTLKSIHIGQYLLFKGKWEVRLDKDSWFSCDTQIESEILSRLVRLELPSLSMSEAIKEKGDEWIKEFDRLLDEWLQTKEHLHECIGYSEGMLCCLEKEFVRNEMRQFLKKSFPTVKRWG